MYMHRGSHARSRGWSSEINIFWCIVYCCLKDFEVAAAKPHPVVMMPPFWGSCGLR